MNQYFRNRIPTADQVVRFLGKYVMTGFMILGTLMMMIRGAYAVPEPSAGILAWGFWTAAGVLFLFCGHQNRVLKKADRLRDGYRPGENDPETVRGLEALVRRSLFRKRLYEYLIRVSFQRGAFEDVKIYQGRVRGTRSWDLEYIRGVVLRAEERYEDALEIFLSLGSRYESPDLSIETAFCLSAVGEYETALGHLFAALSQDPSYYYVYYYLGNLYENMERFDEAEIYYNYFLAHKEEVSGFEEIDYAERFLTGEISDDFEEAEEDSVV